MKLSVVISTYDRQDDLIECLGSLKKQFYQPDEIVVVDDGDLAATRDQLEKAGLMSTVRHVPGESAGLPASRNRGADTATGDIIAFVDDDVLLPPNWSRELVRAYEQNPDAMGIGGYVLNYSPQGINKADKDSFSYRLLTGLRRTFLYNRIGQMSPVGILYTPHIFMTPDYRCVDGLQGCNMSVRAEAFEAFQFDEWYGTTGSNAGEELDFSYQISSAGNKLIYTSAMVALHKRSLSGEDDPRAGDTNYGNTANLSYFVLKNMSIWNFVLFAATMTGYALVHRDTKYLSAVQSGISSYWQVHSRTKR